MRSGKKGRMTKSLHSNEYALFISLLQKARATAGITQQEVANALGRPQSFVAKVEGGERRLDVPEFVEFARAMNCDPEELFKAYLANIDR